MASLANIDQRLSTKRRELADAINAKGELLDKIDACFADLEAIEASEAKEGLDAKVAEHKQLNKSLVALADKVHTLQAEVSDLENQRTLRAEHNVQSTNIGNPLNRVSNETVESNFTVKEPTRAEMEHDVICAFRNAYVAKRENISIKAVLAGEAGDQYRNDRLAAAMTKSNNGTTIPENYRPVLVEMLRAKTVIRKMEGLSQLPLLNGNLRLPRQATGSTASYSGELANIPKTNITTDEITLAEKKLTVLVVSSGELWRQSSPAADAMIRNDIVRQVQLAEDATFIRAAGSATVPRGLKSFADDASVVATQRLDANATVNLANVTADIGRLILALENANVPMLAPYFLMAPRTERFLMDLRDGNGNYAFPEMARGQLRGYPYLKTTAIPTNLTVTIGSARPNSSELYFVDATEMIVADSPLFDMSVSMEAAYDDNGTMRAAFSQDAVVFRCMVGHDTAMRHLQGVAYLQGVTWA